MSIAKDTRPGTAAGAIQGQHKAPAGGAQVQLRGKGLEAQRAALAPDQNTYAVQRKALSPVQLQQAPAQTAPVQVLTVSMVAQSNITNANGAVIGMSGTQDLTYTQSGGGTISETHNVNWEEDATVEGNLAYEHPAQPETFNIIDGTGTYPIATDHSEGGICIHGPGRSEGCILANATVRSGLQARLDANEAIQGQITAVTDSRSAAEQTAAPMPF